MLGRPSSILLPAVAALLMGPLVAGANALPDGREWEMVSPLQKQGAEVGRMSFTEIGVVRASVNGDAISYLASVPTEAYPAGYSFEAQVLSVRGGSAWSSTDISPPHEQATGEPGGGAEEFRRFSEDVSRAIVMPIGPFPESMERTPELRTDYFDGQPTDVCVSSCYLPLVTAANTPPGTRFGVEGEAGPQFVTATGDLSHVLMLSAVALTPQPLESEGGKPLPGLYEWSGESLQLLSSFPAGEPAKDMVIESHTLKDIAISEGGSRVAWAAAVSGPAEGEHHVYMHDSVSGQTTRLDVPEAGGIAPSEWKNASVAVAGMTAGGSKIFFLDDLRLASGSHAEYQLGKSDLYAYDTNAAANRRLTDLSVFASPAGEPAGVTSVLAAGSSYVYFSATGALAPGSAPGAWNLYVMHDNGAGWERPKLVASLASEPASTSVSPGGRYVAFSSSQKLTSFDNRDLASGLPDAEVYLYDVTAPGIACVSCDPSTRPRGAATLPGEGRVLLDDGRLLFESPDALIPQDINEQRDVYEYDPPGLGDCAGSGMTVAQSGGCVSLISSGMASEGASFLEASGTGGDVFFVTTEKLLRQDSDNAKDVYDAHECTGAAPCFPPPAVSLPECSNGDACKGPLSPQPPIYGVPASATFSGHGNVAQVVKARRLTRARELARALRACRRNKSRRQRAACELRARRRFGPERSSRRRSSAKRSSRGRSSRASSRGGGGRR